MKDTYVDEKTVEEQWAAHVEKCPTCSLYVEGRTATLAHVCVIGAPLIKAILEKEQRPALAAKRKADREIYKHQMGEGRRVSTDELKRITRYK